MIVRMNADPRLGLTPEEGLEYESEGYNQNGISKRLSFWFYLDQGF